jgi:hypothetical protein
LPIFFQNQDQSYQQNGLGAQQIQEVQEDQQCMNNQQEQMQIKVF